MNIKYNVEKPSTMTEYTKIVIEFINNSEYKNMLIECENEKQSKGITSSFIAYFKRLEINNIKLSQKKINDVNTLQEKYVIYVEKLNEIQTINI